MKIDEYFLRQVFDVVFKAGEYLQDFYHRSVQIQTKSDNTPVTEADLFLSEFLSQKLTNLTPHFPVLSEENCHIPLSTRQNWENYWLIDPLDGTQQFINRTGQFSIMITLVAEQQPILGIIHAPILGKTYYAIKGQGAFLITNKTQRLSLLPVKNDNKITIAVGSTSVEKIQKTITPSYQPQFLPFGSSSLKAGLLAEGLVDFYVRLGNTGEWDTAAAEVLLNEVGGKILNTNFEPLTYNQRESLINPHFVMGNANFDWYKIFQFYSQ